MSIPNNPGKYNEKAVIEPSGVIIDPKKLAFSLCLIYLSFFLGFCSIEKRGIRFRKGTSWTTDAVCREATEELKQYRGEGATPVVNAQFVKHQLPKDKQTTPGLYARLSLDLRD